MTDQFPKLNAWCETPLCSGRVVEGPKIEGATQKMWLVRFSREVPGVGIEQWVPTEQIKPL